MRTIVSLKGFLKLEFEMLNMSIYFAISMIIPIFCQVEL